jgi:alanyl-tRNA synthetase
MTRRLYFDDPYLTGFAALVVERLVHEGRPAVVLDRSAFYPSSGGQPHDTGRLNAIPVLDVVEREENGPVVHILAAALEAEQVEGEIDWPRRFDLMQQHSGQHILSAASLQLLGATTAGFHLAEEYATIDLDRAPLSIAQLAEVEELANSVVVQNRPVVARFVVDEELRGLPLRKPVNHSGPVRVVQMGAFDCSACGGTHVRATGEIGLIKITRAERRGTETRLEFLCGRRALRDYDAKNALLTGLAAEFTVGYWEVPDMVHRLAGELQQARRDGRPLSLFNFDIDDFRQQQFTQPPVLPVVTDSNRKVCTIPIRIKCITTNGNNGVLPVF